MTDLDRRSRLRICDRCRGGARIAKSCPIGREAESAHPHGTPLLALDVSKGRGGGACLSIWDLPMVIRRSWPVALVGLLTSLVAGLWVVRTPGVYYEQVNVIFLMPDTPGAGNALQNGNDNLIRTAGVVARIVSNNWSGPEPVSDSATLLGQGISRGFSVRLPNAGGQWAYNFDRPQLNVEVVGTSPADVQTTMSKVLVKVNASLTGLQNDERVRPSLRIQTRLSPPSETVRYVAGSRVRAFAVIEVLEVSLTLIAMFALERWRRDRTGRAAADRAPADARSLVRIWP